MIAMPITATKTYNEMVSSDPSIEAGLLFAGYTAPTVQGIRSWFGDRVVCDDANFKNYFLRLASPLADKYNAQLRLETIDKNFDPLVENYLERYIENGGQDKKTPANFEVTEKPIEYTKFSKPADVKKTGHPAYAKKTEEAVPEKKTSVTPIGYQDEYVPKARYTKEGEIKNKEADYTDNDIADNDVKGASKVNPMSSVGITNSDTGITGNIENGLGALDWDYSSSQEQSTTQSSKKSVHQMGSFDEHGDLIEDSDYAIESYNEYSEGGDPNNAENTQSDITKRTYTEGATEDTVITQGDNNGYKEITECEDSTEAIEYGSDEYNKTIGFEKFEVTSSDQNGKKSTEYKTNETSEYGRTIKERVTGRASLTPQQALSEAITYLRTISPAFFDLMVKLEPAFLGVYDI